MQKHGIRTNSGHSTISIQMRIPVTSPPPSKPEKRARLDTRVLPETKVPHRAENR
jgi:hypothetical protein